ncbi:sigma-70 family RNA polymerase sigma factor [Amycolatopsis sp. cmx-11-51]|uniref:sigma-70 family RNA polymerase sigma factor n=1 Tax=unclassified Amycolatopsis TaxID=2618356 RepID=UPI0039E37AD2
MTDTDNPALCRRLLQRAGHGDTAAFAELYDRTSQSVFRLVRSILTEAGAAEDVTCEVYLHLWRTAPHYGPGDGDPFTLLMTTARRYALDQIDNTPTGDGASEQLPRTVSSECVAGLVEQWACTHLLAAVPLESRETLVLVYVRGRTPSEVAEQIGIPEATVISRLHDAFSALRRQGCDRPGIASPQAAAPSQSRPREDAR